MASKERVSILIDAGNFYHLALKKLGVQEAGFDFEGFAKFLANGRIIVDMGKRFYVGTVREKEGDPRSKEAMAKQTSLFTILKRDKWEIKTSKLKTRLEEITIDSRVVDYQRIRKAGIDKIRFERLREKGIDVKLATDLIVGAVDNQYDTAIVVSSDSDLVPAIDWVRIRKKKKVEYIGFSIPDENNPKNSTNPMLSLVKKTDVKRILIKSDVQQFIRPPLLDKKQ
ncbi:MAG: NYN domain-containing protein [Candidatus Liptonbacteria bacterium]|nr:NYN domain-containing protein [Candidatus Liptonbacteria bacterium]